MKTKRCLVFFVSMAICTLFSGCQSVKDFLTSISSRSVSSTSDAQKILDTLDRAESFAERLDILQRAYAAEPSDSILQSISAEVDTIVLAVSPDCQQCECGGSFNLMVSVTSNLGEEVGSVAIDVKYPDGTQFDTLKTGSDGVFFGDFTCGTEYGYGQRSYKLVLALDDAVAAALGDAVPECELLLIVDKVSVTADIRVDKNLHTSSLENMLHRFMSEQLDLNVVAPGSRGCSHVQIEIFTSKSEHTYAGYSANVSAAFYISDSDGVVVYELETDIVRAAANTGPGVVENGLEKIFEIIEKDPSFKTEFKNAVLGK